MSAIDTTNYDAMNPRAASLVRGGIGTPGQSVNAGASVVQDANTSGADELTVEVDQNGSAVGDVVVTVFPYEADGLTLMPVPLPTIQTITNVATGGKVYAVQRFDVTAFERVQVQIKNNNAGAQTLNRASWRTG